MGRGVSVYVISDLGGAEEYTVRLSLSGNRALMERIGSMHRLDYRRLIRVGGCWGYPRGGDGRSVGLCHQRSWRSRGIFCKVITALGAVELCWHFLM